MSYLEGIPLMEVGYLLSCACVFVNFLFLFSSYSKSYTLAYTLTMNFHKIQLHIDPYHCI